MELQDKLLESKIKEQLYKFFDSPLNFFSKSVEEYKFSAENKTLELKFVDLVPILSLLEEINKIDPEKADFFTE